MARDGAIEPHEDSVMNLFLLIAKGMDHDIPNPEGYNQIAAYLGIDEVTPLEIIERLQKTGFNQASHIGNEHMELLLGRICGKLKAKNIECSYYINSLDTHLYVNGNEVRRLEDVQHLLDANPRH